MIGELGFLSRLGALAVVLGFSALTVPLLPVRFRALS
jgi:hypothetical protein